MRKEQCTLSILLLSLSAVQTCIRKQPSAPFVHTSCGPIEGLKTSSYVFKGIPYAKPPISSLRWKPPIPLTKKDNTCWDDILKATEFGNWCVQRDPTSPLGISGSEDCLYLNVWTPTMNRNANLPVMVWIHGGSLTELSGNFPTYSPSEEVAEATNMVYVSMNYRLNAFGFMTLSTPLRLTGNYGFMDQILALKWVQDNIRNFGGNPNLVTLFGQSSGATGIMVLMASPLTSGLFHRVWMMSGSALLNKTYEEAAFDNKIFLKNTKCTGADCLINLPAKNIMEAIPWDVYPYWAMDDFGDLPTHNLFVGALAVIDGLVLPASPFELWKKGKGNDVPVIIGSTAQELDYFPKHTDIESWTWDDYVNRVSEKMNTFPTINVSQVLGMYPTGVISPEYQYTTMGTDIRVTCPVDVMTHAIESSYKAPVYRYVVTAFPTEPAYFYGVPFKAKYSAHGIDAFAFFNTLRYYYQISKKDEELTDTLRKEIINFVKTGKTSTSRWDQFPDKTAVLSNSLVVTGGYHKQECSFWIKHGLLPYSWVN